MAVTNSSKLSLLSLAEVQSSYLSSTQLHLAWVGAYLPTGRPRMCSGDGSAKRNRRVSWLMTCKKARDVGQHPGQRGHHISVSPITERSDTDAHRMSTHNLPARV